MNLTNNTEWVEELELKKRKDIYNYILKYPGLHLNELCRKMKIPKSTMNYHLNHLIKKGFLVAAPNGRYVRYYIANNLNDIDKKIVHFLRQDVPYKILVYLFLHPNSSQIKISKNLKKHPTTISFHLKKLLSTDIIEGIPNGNEIKYKLKNQEEVSNLFVRYSECFF
ncbi:MAG: winged helix-turn-helix transcriptional regulator [Candidatus Thermoplasmatota archaeon]|nr:winged helix-turn-helix transcriptional regulator [Candidatus Thermoplasmatota archaeon]